MLAYSSQPCSEAMAMRPEVTYTTYATSLREQDVYIIKCSQFEEGNTLTKIINGVESGDKSNENSIMPPLLSKEEMVIMDSGDESENYLISTEMLENIRDIC